MLLRCSSLRRGRHSGGLVSAFGSSIHGYHRRFPAFYPEPVDVWLAALTDAVPFYQRCIVVCPSTMSDERAKSLLYRAREILPSVRLAPLRRRQFLNSQRDDAEHARPGAKKVGTKGGVMCGTLPVFASPLEDLPPRSLDLVVFAANVFGEEMLHDAPWHMSLAHRCLDSHGVVAIMGYATQARVVAPEAARGDADDFLEELRHTARETAAKANSLKLRAAMSRAIDVTSSLDVGHADTYFPFRSTKRRWFVSEYAATPAQLAASYRALPEYQLLSSGANSPFLSYFLCGNSLTDEKIEDYNDEALNVLRRNGSVDPLEALQGCLQAREEILLQQKKQNFLATLRVHVRHFVITCSLRSVNSISEASQLPVVEQPPQLR